ncbi:MAG: ATP-binding cassette domain-containing protein [Ignavibacteriales bacterium]|nr:ATP-binding cassette domain-containing protein [Ignavibacteriales bacterium]
MIRFEKVSVSFDNQPILLNVDLHIKPGEFISLVGESGVGKTTLLRLIYFDVFPDNGTVSVAQYSSEKIIRLRRKREIPKLRRKVGVVFQDFKLLEDRNVYDNVAFALHVTGVKRNEIGKRVLRVLADVGLSHKRDNMPEELSGGEQQRVVFARALVNEPIVLLADEPTGNLDPTTAMDLLQLMKTINSRGTAVVLATHNYELVRKTTGRITQIKDGKVSEIESI